jgi:hypothetical protein
MNITAMMREQVKTAYDEMIGAGRAWYDGRRAPESFKRRQRYDAAIAAYESLRDAARSEFAKSHGWRYNPKKWDIDQRVIDHAEVFEDANGRRAGLLTHTYANHAQVEQYAAAHGLFVEYLPWSWHAPDIADAVLFTPKALQ